MKSVKRSLKIITRDFTEKSLYTFPCEVAPVINNRPLTPASERISSITHGQREMDNKFATFRNQGPINFSIKNAVRSVWSTGPVIETYHGVDGVVRSVKVKTPNDEFVGPVALLRLLEVVS